MLICPSCHSENPDKAKFCIECGADLQTLTREKTAKDDVISETDDHNGSDVDKAPVKTEELQGFNNVSVAHEARSIFEKKDDDSQLIDENQKSTSHDFAGLELIVDSSYVPPNTDENTSDGSSDARAQTRDYSDVDRNTTMGSKRRHRVFVVSLIVVVVLIVAGAIGAVATYNMQIWGGKVIPDVSGSTREDAVDQLENVGFEVSVERVKSDDSEGIALGTDPEAGKRSEEGSDVVLYVSIARYIPDIVGLNQETAETLLHKEGLENIEYIYEKANETEGNVLEVNPAEGQRVTQQEHIVVTLAQSYVVPDVIGMDVDQARETLSEEGYETQIMLEDTEDNIEGEVISVSPDVGTKYHGGRVVTLYVAHNRSNELIELATNFLSDEKSVMSIHDAESGENILYEIDEVTSVVYEGDGICSFSVVARPYEIHTWMFGLGTEKRYGESEIINGEIHFDSNNEIASVSPEITQES